MLCSRVRSKIINFSVLNSTRKLEFFNLGCLNFADGAVKIIWTNLIRKQQLLSYAMVITDDVAIGVRLAFCRNAILFLLATSIEDYVLM